MIKQLSILLLFLFHVMGVCAQERPRFVADLPVPVKQCGMWDIVFSRDGRTIAGNQVDKIILWDTASQKQTVVQPSFRGLLPSSLVVASQGLLVAEATTGEPIKLWDLSPKKLVGELAGHTKDVVMLAVSPDGTTLASGDFEGTTMLWDLAEKKKLATFAAEKKGGLVSALAFSPDGKSLLVATGRDQPKSWGTICLWDIHSGRPRWSRQEFGNSVNYAQFAPDGKTVAAAPRSQPIHLWDSATGKPKTTWRSGLARVYSVRFSPDGSMWLAGGGQPDPSNFDDELGEVRFWDVKTERLVQKLRIAKGVSSINLSPDGKLLVIAAGAGIPATVWDVSATFRKSR